MGKEILGIVLNLVIPVFLVVLLYETIREFFVIDGKWSVHKRCEKCGKVDHKDNMGYYLQVSRWIEFPIKKSNVRFAWYHPECYKEARKEALIATANSMGYELVSK